MAEKIQACPKCGGTNGFEFTALESHTYSGAWGEEAADADVNWAKFPKTVKCTDCGKRIDIDLAEGVEDASG